MTFISSFEIHVVNKVVTICPHCRGEDNNARDLRSGPCLGQRCMNTSDEFELTTDGPGKWYENGQTAEGHTIILVYYT